MKMAKRQRNDDEDGVRRKLIAFDAESWHAISLLARDSMKSLQELADEAFMDLLRKHNRPLTLKDALRRSVRLQPANDAAPRTAAKSPKADAGPRPRRPRRPRHP
jgi:hypothetical protein